MANPRIDHSAATELALHENKGVADADDSTSIVAVSGTSSWAGLTTKSFDTGLLKFQGQLFHVQWQDTQGTNAYGNLDVTPSNFVVSSNTVRYRINTVITNEITDASLTSEDATNTSFVLPTGTYFVKATLFGGCQGNNSGTLGIAQAALKNSSTSTKLLTQNTGNTNPAITTIQSATAINLMGQFTLAASTTLEFNITFKATSGSLDAQRLVAGGNATNLDDVGCEIWADACFWKLN